jgi:hypothetical protein
MEVVMKPQKFCFVILTKATPVRGRMDNIGLAGRSQGRHAANGGGWRLFERNFGRSKFTLKNQSGCAELSLL